MTLHTDAIVQEGRGCTTDDIRQPIGDEYNGKLIRREAKLIHQYQWCNDDEGKMAGERESGLQGIGYIERVTQHGKIASNARITAV